ncbi:MAG: cytochrome c oxidase subunit 3 [Gemmatimonadota bacterium]
MSEALAAVGAVRHDPEDREGPYTMGLVALLATVGMLFAAFTAALFMRRTGSDWTSVALPSAVWINTLFLIGSSLTVELSRAAIRRDAPGTAAARLRASLVLGTLFLIGQVAAWSILARQGVFLPSSPNASFFYMLSAVHGLHVLGGLGALLWVRNRTRQGAYSGTRHRGIDHAAIYWHFVGAVWIYLFILLSIL